VHAFAFLASEQAIGRHLYVVKEQFGRILCMHAHLVQHSSNTIACQALGLHHDEGHAAFACFWIGLDQEHQ